MLDSDWKDIKHFKANEPWGDVAKIEKKLILALDKYRELIGEPILVTCGTQGTHEPNSFHYKGMAVDIIPVQATPKTILDYFFEALRIPEFGGIGVYSHWSLMGRVTGGLHLDIRPDRAMWIGTQLSGKRAYLGLDVKNLKISGMI